MTLRATALMLATGLIAASVHAADFTRWSSFKTPAAFVEAAKAFKPAVKPADLSPYFTTRDLGQPDDPKTGQPIPATSLRSCDLLWSDESAALVFATAAPDTEATPTVIGVLFLLKRFHEQWNITDLHQFTATGKYASVTAVQNAGTGTGYRLGSEGEMRPVVTVREDMGGGGYGYLLSASYSFSRSRLERRELE